MCGIIDTLVEDGTYTSVVSDITAAISSPEELYEADADSSVGTATCPTEPKIYVFLNSHTYYTSTQATGKVACEEKTAATGWYWGSSEAITRIECKGKELDIYC